MRCLNAVRKFTRAAQAAAEDSSISALLSEQAALEAYGEFGTLRTHSVGLDAQGRVSAEAALAYDTYLPEFSEALPFVYRFYAFRRAGEGSEVWAAFLFPGERLEPETVDGQLLYSPDVSFILADSAAGEVYRADSVFQFRSPERLGPGQFIRAHLNVAAEPSRSAFYRVAVRDANAPRHGRIYGGPIAVRDLSGGRIGLSDLVLAERGGGPWWRGGVSLALRPTHQFRVGEPLVLFYEIYDLPAGAPYRTEVTIEREGLGIWSALRRFLGLEQTPLGLTLRFEGLAGEVEGLGLQEMREITTGLAPGTYVLRVKVTNLEWEESATAETTLRVVE